MNYCTFVASVAFVTCIVAFEIAFVGLIQQLGNYPYFDIWIWKVCNVDLELNDC